MTFIGVGVGFSFGVGFGDVKGREGKESNHKQL